MQYDIVRAATKIYIILLGKIDKYEYLKAERIEGAIFIYSLLGKAFEKTNKNY